MVLGGILDRANPQRGTIPYHTMGAGRGGTENAERWRIYTARDK